jgi:heme O synthase-like polyprenyltransferase
MKFFDDYEAAGVPTFPSTSDLAYARTIAISTSLPHFLWDWLPGALVWTAPALAGVLVCGLLMMAWQLLPPSERINWPFKYVCLYVRR